MDAEAEVLILWPSDAKNRLIGKDPDAGKDWRQEEKGTSEDKMVGWHHWLNGHEFEQALGVGDGQQSLVCFSPWGCKESDMTEQLNWTERKSTLNIHCKDWYWSCSTLATWCEELTPWKRPWCWERLKAQEEGRGGWDGWIASVDMSLSKLQETVKEREAWRAVAHGVAENRTWLGNWTTTVWKMCPPPGCVTWVPCPSSCFYLSVLHPEWSSYSTFTRTACLLFKKLDTAHVLPESCFYFLISDLWQWVY